MWNLLAVLIHEAVSEACWSKTCRLDEYTKEPQIVFNNSQDGQIHKACNAMGNMLVAKTNVTVVLLELT